MVSVRKRLLDDRGPAAAADAPRPSPELRRLRNMWQFACLCQWLYIFGPVIKLDAPDIDELEAQCLSPHSTTLQEIGLAMLKYLSSHRGLTADLFDEYTRRQYVAKAPELPNPFGTDEIPDKFSGFDAFKKVRVLHQMTQFIMMNSEKLREKMAEQKDVVDQDQTSWRIEPFGWDSNDDTYFVLDDNRVYRLKELPPAPPRPKKNTKKARAQARRASKRRRVSTATSSNDMEDEAEDTVVEAEAEPELKENDEAGDDGLGGMKWECVAVSLDEIRQLLGTIPGRKDANEKILHSKIVDHLLPIIEQQEEKRRKRDKEREKELLNMAKLAQAKRSSRIAGRQEQIKQEELQREEETKRRHDEEVRRKEEQKLRKLERDRDNRLMSRENRLRERELRRLQHQEELSQLSEDSKSVSSAGGPGRISERQRAAEIEKTREALRELEQEEDEEWVFDCVCGLHGKVDDGQHSVSCERCNIWQHSRCLGINEEEAEKDDFHFVCSSCRRRSREAETGVRSPIVKIKVNRPAVASNSANGTAVPQPVVRSALEPPREGVNSGIPVKIDAAPQALTSASSNIGADPVLKPAETSNGIHNPFSSPHPELSPPGLSPRKSHAYDTIYEQASPTPVGLMRKFGDHSLSPNIAIRAPALLLRPTNEKTAGGPPASPTKPRAEGPAGESSGSSQPSAQTVLFPPPTPSSASSTRVKNELSGQQQQQQRTPSVVMTPRLHHPQRDDPGSGQRARTLSPLLPSHGGLSPTKQSPSVANDFSASFPSSSPTPPIFPPAAALSPSAPKQDPTPPIKSGSFGYRQVSGGPPSDRKSSPAARE
ncbi:phd finger domain protein [Grosmannia clavigera kw1407]|uniref:Phd finger domain protein n=1 Tax=Grosmannia clavigera (strain kw1407 / UAMH 11150) TaxID=655863 RepID=F0XMG9_GROCL|nr:phd finger domain protein [Grosmannia clavigera kw1407]EFX01185.1 phd finger domain protein [Grosmannia clavigera kw1407]